ncbi:MAG TPA: pentapeptide repeat-containing protein [Ktedonobacteraceae bacterium]|nr:pentapeptide repeat-containing protein [Ktedonobacteraceae bacterium]
MRWLKRERWKAGIALVGMLLLLVLIVWVPVPSAGAYEGASGLATPGTATAQATPTEDATVTALNKEKLAQEVQQLKNQNEPDFFGRLQTNAVLLSTVVVVLGSLVGLFRWFGDRRSEREKRAEERFQKVVEGLGDDKEGKNVGAAIMLRIFLQPGYERFYSQAFDLAVVHLRLREVNPNEPIDSLSQALIRVFTESSELVREEREKLGRPEYTKYLDASRVRLDGAYIARARLQKVWLREAYLIGADLHDAKLQETDLIKADLTEAKLQGTDLPKAKLRIATLSRAILRRANLMEADLYGVELTGADLEEADLREANLEKTKPETAKSLKGAKMQRVRGLTKEQLEACKAKGAIIDEGTTTSPPVSPPAASLSNDTQAPSAQVNTATPGAAGSNTPSLKPRDGTQVQSAQASTPLPEP